MRYLQNLFGGYTPSGRIWLAVGVSCIAVDVAIGFLGGVSVGTFWHGVGYAALALGFAFLPDAAYEEWEQRRYVSAVVMAIVCIPIGVKAYEQQLTYSTGVRQGEMQAVGVQNTKYDGKQDDVKRHRAELQMLMALREKMIAEAPWAATVKADALREQAATLDKSIREEGGKQNGGCKRKCLDLMAQKQEVDKRVGMAEKVEKDEARIAELQAIIDTKRVAADSAEHKQSLNVYVAQTTARLFKLMSGASAQDAISPDETSVQYATLGSAGLGALSLLILAPVGIFLARRRRITQPSHAPASEPSNRTEAPPASPLLQARSFSPALSHVTVAQLRAMAA